MTHSKDAAQAHKACVECLRAVPGYVERFEKVFGTKDFNIDHVAQAIATFERTVLSGNAPFDRYKAGDKQAMSEAQVRGMDVFFKKASCDRCHIGFNFTDGSYENIGIGMDKPNPDLGRYLVTKREEEKGAFKTPTLREIEHTAPYMHDGSLKTLEEVVEHYDKGGVKNQWLNQRMAPLKLTKEEKADLVSFLKALSGEGWRHIKAPTSEQMPR
jgi:cytochrome c peroxidase